MNKTLKRNEKKIVLLSCTVLLVIGVIFISFKRDSHNKEVQVSIPENVTPEVGHIRYSGLPEDGHAFEFSFEYYAAPIFIDKKDPNSIYWISKVKEAITSNTLVKVYIDGTKLLKIEKATEFDTVQYEKWLQEHSI